MKSASKCWYMYNHNETKYNVVYKRVHNLWDIIYLQVHMEPQGQR